MNNQIFIIIAAIVVIILSQLYFNKTKPSTLLEFMVRLVGGLVLVGLVWGASENTGVVQYKILLTVVAVVSIIQSFLSYRRGIKLKSKPIS